VEALWGIGVLWSVTKRYGTVTENIDFTFTQQAVIVYFDAGS